MKRHPYLPLQAEIEAIKEETSNIKTFRIRPEEPVPFKAGQFVELTVPGVGEAPFTPSSSPVVKETLEITIMKVGLVTEILHGLKQGEQIGVRGPMGTHYPLEKFNGREVVLVGGGCGAGPLRALLFALIDEIDNYKRVLFRYGARTPDDIVFNQANKERWGQGEDLDVLLTVDIGHPDWNGNVGVVTTILDENHLPCDTGNAVVVMCGPPLMMRFTTLTLLGRGFKPENMYLSIEKNMSCGIGKCGHCRFGPYYACKEGPVFTLDQVQDLPELWED